MGQMGDRMDELGAAMDPRTLDARIAQQATNRADAARQRAIEEIKDEMIRNPSAKSVQELMGSMGYDQKMRERMVADPINERYGPDFDELAYAQMGAHVGPVEALNRSMAENPYARYGVIGSAAVGGGAAMTAGAQKLLSVMGLLEEANQTEVAREMPLQS